MHPEHTGGPGPQARPAEVETTVESLGGDLVRDSVATRLNLEKLLRHLGLVPATEDDIDTELQERGRDNEVIRAPR